MRGQETWKWYRRPGATRGSNLPGCPIVLLALLYCVFRVFLDASVDRRRSDGSLPAGAPGPRHQLRVHGRQVQVCRKPFPVSSTGRVRSRPIVNRDDHASSAFRGRRRRSGMVRHHAPQLCLLTYTLPRRPLPHPHSVRRPASGRGTRTPTSTSRPGAEARQATLAARRSPRAGLPQPPPTEIRLVSPAPQP